MNRRNFLKNTLGIAGLLGLAASGTLIHNAMAQESPGPNTIAADGGLELANEVVDHDFKYDGHHIRILRREFRRRGLAVSQSAVSGGGEERWVMTFNGHELPQNYFSHQQSEGGFCSDLLPFNKKCSAKRLAKLLAKGQKLRIFDITA